MRLDARFGHRGYQCFDMKRCRIVRDVVWVDDVTAQWGMYQRPFVVEPSNLLRMSVHQEERIQILLDAKLILFNPIEGCEPTDIPATIEQGTK